MELDKNQLEQNNGQDGKPTYVAIDGKIYDLSASKLWKNGKHMNRHRSGDDLSNDFEAAPHGKEVLQRFNAVGELKEGGAEEKTPVPQFVMTFLEKHPFFKRHPHPMVVHFPMAFFITSSLFLLWYYLVDPIQSLLDSIFYMHILGTISLPAALFTGWFAWKVNYLGKPMGYITRKIILSIIVVIFDVIVLIVIVQNPQLLVSPQGIEILIPIFIISYLPIVSIIGHHGGQLVY